MDVRAQLVMTFNLDKCLGCHTCSISCKNIWTDRKGAEYMWWNNVETKPGAGYPKFWEDQEKYKGGWVLKGNKVKLKAFGKLSTLLNMFFQPHMPKLEDYYHPWTYEYSKLYEGGEEDDQPVAEPVSLITGEKMEIEFGPNWDDDLGGSPLYAENDVNLEERRILHTFSKLFMFYLPRICNHCLNPACVGACPQRAIYKRGEDGIVLVDQNTCRGWRFCVTACPYKKVYYNWNTGKSEKCIFCYPRVETAQANACAHSCVGKIRHVGVLLYDADGVDEVIKANDRDLVEAQRRIILDPNDERIVRLAKENGIPDSWIEAARKSPAYAFVKEYEIAFPLHPEFRTVPMTFYIPPLSPILATQRIAYEVEDYEEIPSRESLRVPVRYLAKLFSAGNEEIIHEALDKMIALRYYMRAKNLGESFDESILRKAGLTPESAERLYRLMTLASYEERFAIPPAHREYLDAKDAEIRKGAKGFGILSGTRGGV